MRVSCLLMASVSVLLLCGRPAKADEDLVDSPMYHNPELPVQRRVREFPEGLLQLWQKALARPEADFQIQAVQSIAEAHALGLESTQSAIPELVSLLVRKEVDPSVRLATARTLIALDDRQAAEQLFQLAESGGMGAVSLVEPVLARWDYAPARKPWLERLNSSGPDSASLIVAIKALGTVREAKAIARLTELTMAAETPPAVRLEAARALGQIKDSGEEQNAKALADHPGTEGIIPRIAAANLLNRHKGSDAINLLQRLLLDTEPAVVAAAVHHLIELDPKLVLPALAALLENRDQEVREAGVQVLTLLPSAEHCRLLNERLDDVHPAVRASARRSLHDLSAKPDLHDGIIANAMTMLKRDSWRGQEQATILLTQLDYKPAAPRFIELLRAPRKEVSVKVGWGLRKLAVRDTLPTLLAYVQDRYETLINKGWAGVDMDTLDKQMSQLVQLMGAERYLEADAMFQRLIPRYLPVPPGAPPKLNPPGPQTRGAGIWALSIFHEGHTDSAIASALIERLEDISPISMEMPQVRWMGAVCLGRMKSKEALPTLRKYSSNTGRFAIPNGGSCYAWAISQITGEPIVLPEVAQTLFDHWFLRPIRQGARPREMGEM
jgi:HEAT repeat protein